MGTFAAFESSKECTPVVVSIAGVFGFNHEKSGIMQEIHELLRVLEQHKINFPQTLRAGTDMEANLLRLLDGVQHRRYATDSILETTPGASADYSDNFATRALLRERLGQALEHFVVELERCPDVQQVHLECQKLWLNVRTMSGRNAATLAMDLATHILKIAEKFDFTLLAMDVAMYLRMQYCMRYHNSHLCADADARYQHLRQVLDAEFRAEKMYTDLIALWGAGRTPDAALQRLANEHVEALEPLLAAFKSSKLHLYGNLVELLKHLLLHDYTAAKDHCEKSIRYFLDKSYRARDPLQVFYYHLLLCSIHLRDVELGTRAALACLEFVNENLTNRFKIKELLFLLCLHTRKYKDAVALFSEVTTTPRFAFLPAPFRANWVVFEAYLTFLDACGAVAFPSEKGTVSGNGDTTLQNQNSSLLLIEYIQLIREKRLDAALDRAPALKQLFSREKGGRFYIFAQMLLLLPKADFRRRTAEQLTEQLLEQLKAQPLELANPAMETEVLPFEDLWQLTLLSLEV